MRIEMKDGLSLPIAGTDRPRHSDEFGLVPKRAISPTATSSREEIALLAISN